MLKHTAIQRRILYSTVLPWTHLVIRFPEHSKRVCARAWATSSLGSGTHDSQPCFPQCQSSVFQELGSTFTQLSVWQTGHLLLCLPYKLMWSHVHMHSEERHTQCQRCPVSDADRESWGTFPPDGALVPYCSPLFIQDFIYDPVSLRTIPWVQYTIKHVFHRQLCRCWETETSSATGQAVELVQVPILWESVWAHRLLSFQVICVPLKLDLIPIKRKYLLI